MSVSQPRTAVSQRSELTKLTASCSRFNPISTAASAMQLAETITKPRVQKNQSLGWAQVKNRSGSNRLIRHDKRPCQDTRRRLGWKPSALGSPGGIALDARIVASGA